MEVIWSDLAIHDLQNIAEYISDNFGDKVSEKSVNKNHITLNPNVIYYLLEKDTIVVMSLIHVKRSPRYVNRLLKAFLEQYES